jgi:hypothetical protein
VPLAGAVILVPPFHRLPADWRVHQPKSEGATATERGRAPFRREAYTDLLGAGFAFSLFLLFLILYLIFFYYFFFFQYHLLVFLDQILLVFFYTTSNTIEPTFLSIRSLFLYFSLDFFIFKILSCYNFQ